MPVLSVPGRWVVHHLLLSVRFPLCGPCFQAGPPDMVEVANAQLCCGFVQRLSSQFGLSDHDHLRGEVPVRFSAPPSDVADQNPHDGCHRLHHHSHYSGHLSGLSSQGTTTVITLWISLLLLFLFDLQCIWTYTINYSYF